MNGKKICISLILLSFTILCSCSPQTNSSANESINGFEEATAWVGSFESQENSLQFYRQIASYMDDSTGWYYQFRRDGSKIDPKEYLYSFHGINLRYRYLDDYWSEEYMQDRKPDGTPMYIRIKTMPGVIHFGQGNKDEKEDREAINSILKANPDPSTLLELDPQAYAFKSFDNSLFFSLMKEALSNPPEENLTYLNWPMWAMDVEPDYIDGYRFQIGFYMKMGAIDEIYIDVLYNNGPEYNAYIQLSDMIDDKNAKEAQKDAFALIQDVRSAIKSQNDFLARSDFYKDKNIGGIDFTRLFTFLQAINNNLDADFYGNAEENRPFIREEISEDEYKNAGNIIH